MTVGAEWAGPGAAAAVRAEPVSRGLPWAATTVPEMRRQWCNALDETVIRHSEAMEPPDDAAADSAGAKRLRRMQAKLADAIEQMKAEADALRGAELYWVARDMVDFVVGAADTLPAWSPALVAPALTGLLCWGKPAGAVPYSAPGKRVDVPWDAVWWWTRPDGVLQLQLASRLTKQPELLAPFEVRSPLWAGHTLVLNPTVPRTAEVMGSPEASQLVSIVGAAWLLMSQPAVTETRTLERSAPQRGEASGETGPRREPSNVTIIELRRPASAAQDEPDGASGRQYRRRWWVGGHWRQQACGPGRTQRKPIWVSPYVKGPEGSPLVAKERVHVLRR